MQPAPPAPPAPPTSSDRLLLALVGGALFGVLFPVFWTVTVFVALAFARSRIQDETIGLVGFILAGGMIPVGALVGSLVSAFGAPAGVWKRRLIAAVVLAALTVLFWLAMLFG